MIVNPPYKRKKINGSTAYLYIYETDDWNTNNTPIYVYVPMCYTPASPTTTNSYLMEDATIIVVTNGLIVV